MVRWSDEERLGGLRISVELTVVMVVDERG